MDEKYASLLAENEALTEEISGLLDTTRRQGREVVALKRELNRATESDPKSQDVRGVLDAWKRLCGHPRAKCPTDGKAWKVTLRAMRHHSRQEVMEAIEGLALMPYVGAHGRQAAGKPSDRYDDVEHALKDETTIRRFRTYRARALGASSLDLFGVYEALAAEADLYLRAAVTRWHREELKRLPASERAAMDVATMRRLREWGLIDTDATTEFLTSQGLIDPTSRVAA